MPLHEREHKEAVAFMQWCKLHEHRWPELALIYHIPNGGMRHKGAAGKLKAEGAKRGVPDYCLPVARWGFHALYVELKAEGGSLSPEQRWWRDQLPQQHNHWVIAVGWEDAAKKVRLYLEGPDVVRRCVEQREGAAS